MFSQLIQYCLKAQELCEVFISLFVDRFANSDMHRHQFVIDVDNPVIVYACNDIGTIHSVDLRLNRAVNVLHRRSDGGSVKALAQSGAVGANHLFFGGAGVDISLLDVRAIGDNSDRVVRRWSPLYKGPNQCRAMQLRNESDARVRDRLGPVSVSGIDVSRDGGRLVGNYQGDNIYLFDVHELPVDGSEAGVGARSCLGGRINYATILKTVHFFGPRDEYVISGGDSGYLWIWDSQSGLLMDDDDDWYLGTRPEDANLWDYRWLWADEHKAVRESSPSAWRRRNACHVINLLHADNHTCNGAVPHPHWPLIASYGIDSDVKLWTVETFDDDEDVTVTPPKEWMLNDVPDIIEKHTSNVRTCGDEHHDDDDDHADDNEHEHIDEE